MVKQKSLEFKKSDETQARFSETNKELRIFYLNRSLTIQSRLFYPV